MQRFAREYAALWELRYEPLAAAVERQDPASALEAIVSLEVSSVMVGALRLAHAAADLELTLRQGDYERSQALVAAIAAHGGGTVQELLLTNLAGNDRHT